MSHYYVQCECGRKVDAQVNSEVEAESVRLRAEFAADMVLFQQQFRTWQEEKARLEAALESYAAMLGRLQPNRPLNVHCPKCGRDMPECVGEPPCYYQSELSK